MREIKFRVRHKGKWVYFTLQEALHPDFFGEDEDVYYQYTGLKDKNGVEIYEGDIFCFPDGRRFYVRWGESKTAEGHTLNDYASWYSEPIIHSGEGMSDSIPTMLLLGGLATAEVIGNIYENPELLEAGE